jgi:hypothetical protein
MIRSGSRVVVIARYDGDHGRAFVGDRGKTTAASTLKRVDFGYEEIFPYEEQYWVKMDRGFTMFIPEGCLRPLRPLELLAECAG